MSKATLERVHSLLNKQLEQKKRSRQWRLIQGCLDYWTQYARIVRVWMEAKSSQVVRNGKQLFEFLIGLNPGNCIVEILKGMSNREKFLENRVLLYCESIFTLMQVHGGKRIFRLEEKTLADDEIDWEEEIEDEAQIIARIEGRMGNIFYIKIIIFFKYIYN